MTVSSYFLDNTAERFRESDGKELQELKEIAGNENTVLDLGGNQRI